MYVEDTIHLCMCIRHKRHYHIEMRSKGDTATPWHSGSMKNEICLCDGVMRDDVQKARDAERVCDVWEQIQCE